ncbi:MAG: helix-turn-helix transcriptional regulator [Rhizobiaceae bacterium]
MRGDINKKTTSRGEARSGEDQAERFVALVGQRVRQARQQKAISRRALSELSGVSQRYLAQLESGAGNISVALLYKISSALGYTPDRLLGPDDPWDPESADFLRLFRAAGADQRQKAMAILNPVGPAESRLARVCLIGLRGAGKTTLGKHLAQDLSVEFVELNHIIEEQSGMPIAEIMALYGEEGYRRLERQAVDSVIDSHDKVVLSVGGGIVSNAETFAGLLRHFHTCWLKARPEEHMNRVLKQGDRRPMAGNPQAMEDLKSILTSREALYAKADVMVDTSEQSVRQSRADLLEAVTQLIL